MDDDVTLERRLLAEIGKLEAERDQINLQLRTLRGLVLMARERKISKEQVTRSNGIHRVMVEQAVLEHLGSAGRKGLASSQLYITGQQTINKLGRSTFASYLRRLQERGLIENHKYGMWRINKSAKD